MKRARDGRQRESGGVPVSANSQSVPWPLNSHHPTQDENEYTGQESYVSEMLKQGSIGYVPNGRALALERERFFR